MEPDFSNENPEDFSCTIDDMSFSKLDFLFRKVTLNLKTKDHTYEIKQEIVNSEPYLIGNDPKIDCPKIKEPSDEKFMSFHHCMISFAEETQKFILKDLNSTNGTWIYLKEFVLDNKMTFKNVQNCFLKIIKINGKEITVQYKDNDDLTERKYDLSNNQKLKLGKTEIRMGNSGEILLQNEKSSG